MTFAEKIRHFILFIVLTVVTLGLYPLYFMITTTRENNVLLRDIRDSLRENGNRSSQSRHPAEV